MDQEIVNLLEDLSYSMSYTGNISSLLSLAAYVFTALSIYTIAQRRGIKHPWMAWVPLINVWTLGSISDQYRYVVNGEVKNKRKVLLTVNIINCVLVWTAVIVAIVILVKNVIAIESGAHVREAEMLAKVFSSFLLLVPALILSIVSFVVQAMALYDLYASCEPANKTLYLVLSLIPGISTIAYPLFLFLCRNKDEGMPPRRETVVENPAEF